MSQLTIPRAVSEKLPSLVRNRLAELPRARQEEFLEEYGRRAKGVAVAYLLWIPFGFHYSYLRKWDLQFFFWLSAGGALLWWLVDFVRLPAMIRDYNRDIATDVMRTLSILNTGRGI